MTDTTKMADDIYMVPWEEGNGQIRREVWVDKEGKVTHYYLAYLNQDAFQGDDGMVLGYDYNNGNLTSHRMGMKRQLNFHPSWRWRSSSIKNGIISQSRVGPRSLKAKRA